VIEVAFPLWVWLVAAALIIFGGIDFIKKIKNYKK
jgi:hypothetical protein